MNESKIISIMVLPLPRHSLLPGSPLISSSLGASVVVPIAKLGGFPEPSQKPPFANDLSHTEFGLCQFEDRSAVACAEHRGLIVTCATPKFNFKAT